MEIEKFRAIVLPQRQKLLAMATKMLANSEDAEDVVQETLLKMWVVKDTLDSHPNVSGYAMQTIKNSCINRLSQNKYNILLEDKLEIGLNTDSPYQQIENLDSIEIVKRIISNLPELQRLTITMRDVEEYELDEIAQIMGSNVAAVKVNLSRARKKVRDIFLNVQAIKIDSNE